MFVKFDCGCIGTPTNQNGENVLIESCTRDHSDDMYCFHHYDGCSDKPYKPLTESEELKLIKDIGTLVSDGYKFRTIRGLLK